MNSQDLLQNIYGPLMHSRDVQQALRFRTADGFRAARSRGRLVLDMFTLPRRRGLFAKTEDVARLLEDVTDQTGRKDM